MLLILFGMMWPYGFSSSIDTGYFSISSSTNDNALVGVCLFMTLIFIVIGFGLLLAYYGENLFSAFFIAVYITSITVIVSPLVQNLWF